MCSEHECLEIEQEKGKREKNRYAVASNVGARIITAIVKRLAKRRKNLEHSSSER
jgi:hypothetical protein